VLKKLLFLFDTVYIQASLHHIYDINKKNKYLKQFKLHPHTYKQHTHKDTNKHADTHTHTNTHTNIHKQFELHAMYISTFIQIYIEIYKAKNVLALQIYS